MKYSDVLCRWLQQLGYTHCFFVGGGHCMHLVGSVATHFKAIPVVHEVAAGLAAEYFCATAKGAKAFAVVTSGPGLTNIMTALAGAFLESRELLVLGGQVKTADLAHGTLRQRGIQELDGVAIAKPVTKQAMRLLEPLTAANFYAAVQEGSTPRAGPVFLEIPLDIQARQVPDGWAEEKPAIPPKLPSHPTTAAKIGEQLRQAKRPVLLLGGGISREVSLQLASKLAALGIPVQTTWNGADRVGHDHPCYVGRPNTWGQRGANLILQQADLVLALGTRLGLQQTGFNWQKFAPLASVIQVDLDAAELQKGHPKLATSYAEDANQLLQALAQQPTEKHQEWLDFCQKIWRELPLAESCNQTAAGYVSPFAFVQQLSAWCMPEDVIVPCSSGGAFTVMMQAFLQKAGQVYLTNKGLASMGYGLGGAIGAAQAAPHGRTILVEGDGGFTQNLQELGTVAQNKLNLKIFIFDDGGYASIRMTQKNYFGGRYMGCDLATGLGLPNWEKIFAAYDIPLLRLTPDYKTDAALQQALQQADPCGFLVPIDPEQTYFPKITSRVLPDGSMVSNPLHRLSPDLSQEQLAEYAPYLSGDEFA